MMMYTKTICLVVIYTILCIHILDSNAQVTNTQVGGPIVPTGQSTQQQYCWNGTCNTGPPVYNGTISANDSNYEPRASYNIIMLIPDESCIKAGLYHVKTNCPALKDVIKYDNSNQNISGKLIKNKDGTYTRTNPQMRDHWLYYEYNPKTTICVYCEGDYIRSDLYKIIFLKSADSYEYPTRSFITSTYTISQYNAISQNYTTITYPTNEITAGLTTNLNRYVQGCNTAMIAYSDSLLNDTINYMESGCKTTSYNKTNTYHGSTTAWSWSNPYSSLHYKSVTDNVKSNPPGNCIMHKCVTIDNRWKW